MRIHTLPIIKAAAVSRPGSDQTEITKCGWNTSEAPPLTAKISGSAGVSLRTGSL
jgi:hypothetical protein